MDKMAHPGTFKRRRVSFSAPIIEYPIPHISLDTSKALEYAWAKSVVYIAAQSKNSVVLSRKSIYAQIVSNNILTAEARVMLSLGVMRLGVDYVHIINDVDKIRFARKAVMRFLVGLGGDSSRLGNRWFEAQQQKVQMECELRQHVSRIICKNDIDLLISAATALVGLYDEHKTNKKRKIKPTTNDNSEVVTE